MTSGASNECTCVARRFAAAVSAAGEGVVLCDDDDERVGSNFGERTLRVDR